MNIEPRTPVDASDPRATARRPAADDPAARMARRAFPEPSPGHRGGDDGLVALVLEDDAFPWGALLAAAALSGALWAGMAVVAFQVMRLLGG